MSASARHEPTFVSASRSVAIVRARVQRQPDGLLRELGGDGRRATIVGESRGLVEGGGDIGVGRVLRKREVSGAEERILDDSRDPSVHAPPILSEILIEDRRQQRVGEADRRMLTLDDVCCGGWFECVRRDAHVLEERLRGRADRRHERERLAGGGRESGDPRAQELFERLGDRQWLEWVDVGVENASELQREERISARPLLDADQRLAREGPAEPVVQELVERAHAERPHRHPPDPLRTKPRVDFRRLRSIGEPSGEQHENIVRGKPSQGERKRARRRWVEPLDVVDGDQNRFLFAEKLHHVAHRDGERAMIDSLTRRLLSQHRDLERVPSRCRERRQGVVEDVLEQIAQSHVSEAALGLGRPRGEDAEIPPVRMLNPGEPERRLPDARFALKYKRSGSCMRLLYEGVEGGEFLLPADDLEHDPLTQMVTEALAKGLRPSDLTRAPKRQTVLGRSFSLQRSRSRVAGRSRAE